MKVWVALADEIGSFLVRVNWYESMGGLGMKNGDRCVIWIGGDACVSVGPGVNRPPGQSSYPVLPVCAVGVRLSG